MKRVGQSTCGLDGRVYLVMKNAGMMFRIEPNHIDLLALDAIAGLRVGEQLLGDRLALTPVYIDMTIDLRRRSGKEEPKWVGGIGFSAYRMP